VEFLPGWRDYALLTLFVFLFLLSGWSTWGLIWHSSGSTGGGKSKERIGPELSCLEGALACLLCSLAVTSVILLLTAQVGIFRIRFWLLLLAVYDLVAVLFSHWKLTRSVPRPETQEPLRGGEPRGSVYPPFRLFSCRFERNDLWALALAIFAFIAFNQPGEFVATNRDPGEYLNIAVKLAETGALRFQDPDFQEFSMPEKQTLFLKDPLDWAPFPEVLPGFYLVDASRGRLQPQFFPLYPLWLSLCFKLWRFGGAFLLNICLGTLSVLLLLPLGERIFKSRLVGLGAGVLLAANPAQVWLSRSPFSEVLVQVFLLGGLWLLGVGVRSRAAGALTLGGLLFGLSLFARVDSVLILPALSLLLFCGEVDRKAFFLPLAACTAYATAHAFLFSFPYVENVLKTVWTGSFPWQLSVLVAALASVGLLFLSRRVHKSSAGAPGRGIRGSDTQSPSPSSFRRFVATALLVVCTLVFAYGVFVRPHLSWARESVPLPEPHVGTVPLRNEINWVRLAWYLTPLGLGLALLGALSCIPRLVAREATPLIAFALILAALGGFYLYKSRAFPDNYWVVRRYIEIVIPGFLLLACLALSHFYGLLSRFVPRYGSGALSALVFLMTWVGEIHAIAPFWRERELAGTLRQMELLASLNQPADILLLEQGPFQEFFSTPLKAIFQKTVYSLASSRPDVLAFDRLLQRWLGEGKRVHLLASQEQTELQSRKIQFMPQHRFEFNTRVVEAPYERLPRSMIPLSYTLQVYNLELKKLMEPPKTVTLNMDFNFGFATKGFHAPETNPERETFRWTSGSASLELPPLKAERAILSLRLAQDFPEKLHPSPVGIRFNERLIAEPRLMPRLEVLRWEIGADLLNLHERNQLSFTSSTYSPAQLGNSEDQRELGIMVDGVKLQSAEPISTSNPLLLDLGSEGDALDADLAGFFGREPDSYRWTEAEAEVRLPVAVDTRTPLLLSLRAVKSCPDPGLRQWLSLSLDGAMLDKVELVGTGTQFLVYEFRLPQRPVPSGRSVIRLTVDPPWNPAQVGHSLDRRTLGCAVDWIRIDGNK
jgi:hypothetical protein